MKWAFYWLLHGVGVCGLLLSFRFMKNETFSPWAMGIVAGLWVAGCMILARLLVTYWDKFKIY